MAKAEAALSCTLAALAAAMLAGCGRKTSVEPAGVAWGKPVNGLQAGIEVKECVRTEKRWIRNVTIRRIEFTLHVRNVGTAPIRLSPLWCSSSGLRLAVRGKAVPNALPTMYWRRSWPPFVREFVVLDPGQAVSQCMLRADMDQVRIENGSEAVVCSGFKNDKPKWDAWNPTAKCKTTVEGLWIGEARSGTVRVTIGRDWRKIAAVAGAATVTLVAAGLAAWCIIRRRRRAKAA